MDQTKSLPNYIEMLSSGTVILVSAGFVVSVIYDWGFLHALGLGFREIPTTVTDHFRTGLMWFPYLIFLIIAYYAIEYQFQRVEKGLTEEEIINSSKKPDRLRKFREGPYRLMTWIAPLGILNFFLIGDAVAAVLPIFLSITWLSFAGWCYSAPLIQLRRNKLAQAAFTLLPVIFIIAFFSGYNNAVEAAQRKPFEVAVNLTKDESSMDGKLLRSFDTGIMIMSSELITYIPWSQIKSITTKDKYKPFRGFILKYITPSKKDEKKEK